MGGHCLGDPLPFASNLEWECCYYHDVLSGIGRQSVGRSIKMNIIIICNGVNIHVAREGESGVYEGGNKNGCQNMW